MSNNYLGEIRIFSWKGQPQGWVPCDGALLNVREYQALYSLLGNRFGGDGIRTFALPDLRGRTIVGDRLSRGRSNDVHMSSPKETAGQTLGNMPPRLVMQHCIAMRGDYPPKAD